MKLIKEDGKHFYLTEGKRLPSVTTVIGLLANPGSEAWRRATPDWEEIDSHAADIGTRVHREIELHLKGWPRTTEEHFVVKCFNAFLQWKNQNEFEKIDTELRVKSEKGYAGTLDLVCKLNGVLYIIDLKTSGRIYPEHSLQLAAYRGAYVEMTKRYVQGMAVLRLDKQTGLYEFREYSYEEYQRGLKMFLLLVEYYHLNQDFCR